MRTNRGTVWGSGFGDQRVNDEGRGPQMLDSIPCSSEIKHISFAITRRIKPISICRISPHKHTHGNMSPPAHQRPPPSQRGPDGRPPGGVRCRKRFGGSEGKLRMVLLGRGNKTVALAWGSDGFTPRRMGRRRSPLPGQAPCGRSEPFIVFSAKKYVFFGGYNEHHQLVLPRNVMDEFRRSRNSSHLISLTHLR